MADITSTNFDPVDANNNVAPPDGFPTGMAPSGENKGGRMLMGAIKRWFQRMIPATTAGTSTAYTLTYAVAPASYSDGETFLVRFNQACGDSPTLNINTLGAIPLNKYAAGAWIALAAADIGANQIVRLTYDQSSGAFRALYPLGTQQTRLATLTASNSASLTYVLPGSFSNYDIRFTDLIPVTDGAVLGMQVSTDGGITWQTTSYVNNVGGATVYIDLTQGNSVTSAAAYNGMSGLITLPNPSNATGYKYTRGLMVGISTAPAAWAANVLGVWAGATTAINAIRFVCNTGNISSGTVAIWGIP